MADGHSRWVELMMGEVYPNHFDSAVAEPTDNYYLQWDTALNGGLGGTNWVVGTSESIPITNLSDVTITTASTGDLLMKSAGDWVNATTLSGNAGTQGTGFLARHTTGGVITYRAFADVKTDIGADVVDDTTPQLGGNLDLNQKQIELDGTALADHVGTGTIITLTTSGTVTLGEVVYINASGEAALADADQVTTMPAIGIALETKTSSACKILIHGLFRDDSWGWVLTGGGEATLLYVSTATGDLTQAQPSVAGDQVQVFGYAITADIIIVAPSLVLVEIA